MATCDFSAAGAGQPWRGRRRQMTQQGYGMQMNQNGRREARGGNLKHLVCFGGLGVKTIGAAAGRLVEVVYVSRALIPGSSWSYLVHAWIPAISSFAF